MKQPPSSLPQSMLISFRNRRNRPAGPHLRDKDEASLTLATYNIHKCVGTDGRFDPGRIIDVICEIGPDILALQEADGRFGERGGLLDLNRVRLETGLVPVPVVAGPKSHGWRGNVLLVRQGTVCEVYQIALPGLEPRGVVVAEFSLSGNIPFRVVATHLGLTRWARRQQTQVIMNMLQTRDDRPTLLMGDLNEWRLGRGSALTGLEPYFGVLPPALPSFPAKLPVLALDRIMANRAGLVADLFVHDTPLSRTASDHLPLAARVDLSVLGPAC